MFAKYKHFAEINTSYTTKYCSLVLCILRKESKCYCDFRLSDSVHILWQLQEMLQNLHFSSKDSNDTVSQVGLCHRN